MALCVRLRSEQFSTNLQRFFSPVCGALPLHVSERGYKGSNRYKARKARNDKIRLRKQLEQKYGIFARDPFNRDVWMKKNYFAEISAFQARLKVKFDNEALLFSAFAHPSFINELQLSAENGEEDLQQRFRIQKHLSVDVDCSKLALIGYESTLYFIKAALYRRYASMTKLVCDDICTFLVSREIINKLAKNLAITDFILLSKELENLEDLNNELHLNFTRDDIVSDAFFALVGAIQKDKGVVEAQKFVEDFLVVAINHEELSTKVNLENPSRELQNIFSMHGFEKIQFDARTILETGVKTSFPVYVVGIYCCGYHLCKGSGYSVYTAKQDAFKNAVFKCLDGEIDFSLFSEKVLTA